MAEFTSAGFANALDPVLEAYTQQKFDEEMASALIDLLFDKQQPENRGDKATYQNIYGMGSTVPERGSVLQYFVGGEGYNTVQTHKAFAAAAQFERELFDDARHREIRETAFSLGRLFANHKAKDAAQIFNQIFSLDSEFMSREEGLALCHDSHTTKDTNTDTSTGGFDNLSTEEFSQAALESAFSTFQKFRQDDGVFCNMEPDCILTGTVLNDKVLTTLNTKYGLNTVGQDINMQSSPRWTAYKNVWITSATQWIVFSKKLAKQFNIWTERVPIEFDQMEHFESFSLRKRGYCRYSYCSIDWRWVYGSNATG